MFTEAGRDAIRDDLIEWADADDRVIGAALPGRGRGRAAQAWADIELALHVSPDADESSVVADWTREVAGAHGVADTLDEESEGARRRVLLLRSSLVMAVTFRAHARRAASVRGFDAAVEVGRGWLSAAEARSALIAGRGWQATIQLDALRDRVVALCASRHGLETRGGRGADQLPWEVRDALGHARAVALTPAQLNGSRRRLLALLLDEARHIDAALADALAEPLGILSADVAPR
ncbi:hypothetical protein GCM10022200_09350 [Microbacterium awajiense]|uniref:DUF222 domain-containing protein n=1 Tax=Microbacterium awajiense TaxID=415214 RepID=A0ABP7ABV2_9MICO